MLEYPSIWGLLPLIVYIVLSFTRFNQLVAVSASVLLGAVMSGQTVLSTARAIQGGLGSFLTYVGLIILLGAGLGEVLNRTGVVKNLVYLVTKKMGVNSPQKAILTTMISSVLLVSLLGTLAGANAIIAPILIPIVAAVGITPSTLAVVFHGAGATGLFLGPFTPPVVALMGFTGITYPQVLLNAGLPISIIMWIITFVVALFIQKRTQGKYSYTAEDLESTELENWKPEGHVNRATLIFLITMGAMVAYGIILKGGSSFAVAVMLITAVITGIAGKMSLNEIFDAICHGASRLMWLFFLFVMFNPFIQFVSETGAFTALANMLQPLIEKSGQVGFLGLSMLVGVFGIPGAAVAQLQVIHEMFLPLVEQLQIPMTLWALVLLVGSQMTFFAFPGGDMIGEMGLARSKDLKSMVINGLILTVAVAGYVMLRAFFTFHQEWCPMLKTLVSKAQKIDGTVGFVFQDLRKNFRRDWNAEEIFPAASVIKLTILWELFRRVERGELSLHKELELRETSKVGGFGILKEMHPGLRPSLEDLATLMIVLSDNVATNMLIDLLGMDAINRSAAELGLHKTALRRKMMDGEAKARGLDNFTSPEDMAHLLWHYMESPDLSESSRNTMLNILLRQQCNNKLPLRMPQDAPLAHKTGDLPGTEHDAGILLLPKRPVILVVMTKDLSRNQDGIAFCNEFGELLYTTYITNTSKE